MLNWFSKQWGNHRSRRLADAGRAAPASLIEEFDAGRAIPDDLVDAVLNDEVSEGESALVFNRLRRTPGAMEQLEGAEYSIDAVKGARPESPDLAGQILKSVDRRKGLFDRKSLHRVWLWRGLAIAGIVLTVAGVFIAERMAPADANLTAAPTPLVDLFSAVPEERGASLTAYPFSDLGQLQSEPVASIDTSSPTVLRASTAERNDQPMRCWCPYQNMLPAGGPASLTAQWVTLVAKDAPAIYRCKMSQPESQRDRGESGFSTVRDLYDSDRIAGKND